MTKQSPSEPRYLINFKIGTELNQSRARKVCAGVAAAMKDISCGKCQLAYTSHDAGTFGILIKTTLPIKEITSTIDRLPGDTLKSSLILKEDQYMILRLGEGGTSIGYGPAMTWLQHNQ